MSIHHVRCLVTTVFLLFALIPAQSARASTRHPVVIKCGELQVPPTCLVEEPAAPLNGIPYPLSPRVENAHVGQRFGIYLDGGQAEHIMFRYRGCHVTGRGAFRLTVYLGDYTTWRPIKQYSQTVIDRRTSDRRWYYVPVEGGIQYVGVVEIPSKRGCTAWYLSSTGN